MCSVLSEICSYYEFSEISNTEITENKGEIIHRTAMKKGVFTDENRHMAVWLRDMPKEFLPEGLIGIAAQAKEANATYVGDKYFLAQLEGEVFGFKGDYYQQVSDLPTSF